MVASSIPRTISGAFFLCWAVTRVAFSYLQLSALAASFHHSSIGYDESSVPEGFTDPLQFVLWGSIWWVRFAFSDKVLAVLPYVLWCLLYRCMDESLIVSVKVCFEPKMSYFESQHWDLLIFARIFHARADCMVFKKSHNWGLAHIIELVNHCTIFFATTT